MIHSLIFTIALYYGGEAASPAAAADNAPCLRCHESLIGETIADTHLKENVGCASCHGPSLHHLRDETVMTKPDILFGRQQVDAQCRHCHEEHEDPARVARYLKRWSGKTRPNGRLINEDSICTDCHGNHNSAAKPRRPQGEDPAEAWTSLVDGDSLAPWTAEGGAWKLRGGRLVATAAAGETLRIERPAGLEGRRLRFTFQATGRQVASFYWRGSRTARIALAGGPLPPASLSIDDRPVVMSPLAGEIDLEGAGTISIAWAEHIEVFAGGEELYRIRRRRDGDDVKAIGFSIRAEADGAQIEISEVQHRPLE
ncbi:MAG: cytochrome c3 family protein [Planctomycetes bacterium]|nr:cytochrome c3 family protein [Planctomycetota bacterium]